MVKRSPLDRLTDLERRLVKLRLAHPAEKPLDLARRMGFKGKARSIGGRITTMLRRPQVVAALTKVAGDAAEVAPEITKDLIMERVRDIALDAGVPSSERLRALRILAEMTPGALPDRKTDVNHTFNLEQFVEAAGGKPPQPPQPGEGVKH